MALEGLRGYLQLAGGLTEVTRRRALEAARTMASSGGLGAAGELVPGQVRAQLSALADEIVATARANRDLMVGLVRGEVDRAVTRLGLVGASELDALHRELDALQVRLGRLELVRTAPTTPTQAAAKAASKSKSASASASKRAPAKTAARTTAARPTATRKSSPRGGGAAPTAAR